MKITGGKNRKARFAYVDTFCGIGGFSQGAHRVGGRLHAACEIQASVREVFARNYGVVPHDDIRTMAPAKPGSVQLLCGGFPCQPFSHAGERLGTQSENGQLFFALLRYAVASKIPCLLLENVTGLLSIEEGRTFREFLHHLKKAGYRASYAVLSSYDFGVPQVRKRLYIVAHRTQTFDFGPLLQRTGDPVPLRPFLDPDLEACRALPFDTGYSLPPRLTPSGMLRCDDPTSLDQTHRVYHPDGPIATMISSNPTKIYDPRLQMVRKLTGREMLACQGFDPERFVFPEGMSHSAMAHMCGNAVTVPVIEQLLLEMIRQGLLP